MVQFLKNYGPVILVIIAVVTLLLNVRQTQVMVDKHEKDCGCNDTGLGFGPI